MSGLLVIEEENLSLAWARAFMRATDRAAGDISPLVLSVTGLCEGKVAEDRTIRNELDKSLKDFGVGHDCETVANTFFPQSLWRPEEGGERLYRRFNKIARRLRAYPRNRHGMYFERMIDFGNGGEAGTGTNQLQHIIETWRKGNHRRSAMQVAIFDPLLDHTHQRQRGFPCLHQVSFSHENGRSLAITGYFATQYVFDRCYGNLLGLSRLGRFMAHEMGLELVQIQNVANVGLLGNVQKGSLSRLRERIEGVIGQCQQVR